MPDASAVATPAIKPQLLRAPQKWTISGALGLWTMTVSLMPEPGSQLDEPTAQRALQRFDSLDCHFYDVVNLTEAVTLADGGGVRARA